MEISCFLPPGLLKKPLEEMDFEEFMEALAKTRYVEEMISKIITKGIVDAFQEE